MCSSDLIATGGVRTFDDCREYFWAGADAVSLGSATWLAATPGYALAPLEGLRIRALLRRVERYVPPRVREAAGGGTSAGAGSADGGRPLAASEEPC